MSIWSKTIYIQAPIDKVFETISTPKLFQKAVPHITKIEFLTDQKTGIGVRFRETRIMNKRKVSTVLEIVDQEKNSHIQMISKTGGTTWDSTFSTEEETKGIQLRLVMSATPHNFLARMTVKMIQKMLEKSLEEDLQAIKAYCEASVQTK